MTWEEFLQTLAEGKVRLPKTGMAILNDMISEQLDLHPELYPASAKIFRGIEINRPAEQIPSQPAA